MKKKSKLLFVQVDHIPGEILGFAIGRLMELGANNVQLVPTITKRSRPGNIIVIDIDAKDETDIAEFLARELSVPGYHGIDTNHICQSISYTSKMLNIIVNGVSEKLECKIKRIGDPSRPLSVSVEHDFLVEVKDLLIKKFDRPIPLNELRALIECKIREPGDQIAIEL